MSCLWGVGNNNGNNVPYHIEKHRYRTRNVDLTSQAKAGRDTDLNLTSMFRCPERGISRWLFYASASTFQPKIDIQPIANWSIISYLQWPSQYNLQLDCKRLRKINNNSLSTQIGLNRQILWKKIDKIVMIITIIIVGNACRWNQLIPGRNQWTEWMDECWCFQWLSESVK